MNKNNFYTIFDERKNVEYDRVFKYGFLIEEMYINTETSYIDDRYFKCYKKIY